MRKNILALFVLICSYLTCSAQSRFMPKHIPERLEGVKETVFYLDSASNALVDWGLDSFSAEDLNTAKETWDEFKNLCEADEYENALDFYMEGDSQRKNASYCIIFLKRTAYQYEFASDVLRPLLFEYGDRETAFDELISLFTFLKSVADLSITINEEGNAFVPERYADLVSDLGYVLAANGQLEEAVGLLDDFALGVSKETESKMQLNYDITLYIADIYWIAGYPEDALKTWEDFKSYHLAHGDEYDPVELAVCLQQADDEIAEIKNYMQSAD